MAKSKKKASSKESKVLTREQCAKIWPLIKSEDWVKFAKDAGREDLRFKATSPTSVLGLCPTPGHAETNPSFTINTDTGLCGCFGCKWSTTNPVVLYSVITQRTIPESFTDLHSKYRLTFLPKDYGEQLEAQRCNSAMKKAAEAVFHDELCQAIACDCTGEYAYAKTAVDWLVDERKISKEVIPVLPVGIFPPIAVLSKRLSDKFLLRATLSADPNSASGASLDKLEDHSNTAVAYFSEFIRGGNNDRFIGAPVFTLYNSPHNIGRFKLRLPEKGHTHVMPPDPFEETPGVFGLGWDQYKACWDVKAKKQSIYAVEGEMDCLSLMATMAETGNVWGPVVSLGGTGSVEGSEESLVRSQVTDVYFIGDAPTKGGEEKTSASGDEAVTKWLSGYSKLRSYVFSNEAWEKLAPADDPDNAVHLDCVGPEKTVLELYTNREENYQPSGQWLFEKAYDKLSKLDPEDYRGLTEAAVDVGKVLLNLLDREAYVISVCEAFPTLKPDPLKRALTSSIVSEESFIMRFKEAIESLMFVIGTDSAGAERRLLCVGRQKETVYSFKLDSPTSAVKELATISGGIVQFILDHVGWPSFIPNPTTKEGDGSLEAIDKTLRFYTNEAVLRAAVGVPDLKDQNLLRQGYHCVRDDHGKIIGEYVVDGGNVFKIISRDHSGAHWIKLDGPRDGDVVFDTGYTRRSIAKSWYPGGLTVEILENGNDVDILAMYKDLVNIYTDGFFFKNHHIVPSMLGAMVMVLATNNAYARQIMAFVTGETSSGKSSFLSTLSPIGGSKAMRLLYCSVGFDGFSEAGISAQIDNSRMTLVLDEAESDAGSGRSEALRMIHELFRSCVSGEGLRIRSTNNGTSDVTIRKVFCPVVYSAISGVEKPQDLNRMFLIETKKVEGRDNVKNIIHAKYGEDFVPDVARRLAVGMFRHIPSILESYAKIEKEYSHFEDFLGFKLEYRYASGFYGMLAVMDVMGLDWREFLREFVTANMDNIERATLYSESASTLTSMMHNPVIRIPSGEKDIPFLYKSIAQLMANPGQRHYINESSVGIFLDEERQLLLVLLDQALVRLLPHGANLKANQLRQTLMRDKNALTDQRIRDSQILENSTQYLGKGIQLPDVVVIEAGNWLRGETSAEFEKKKRKEAVPQAIAEQKGLVAGDDRATRTDPIPEPEEEEVVQEIEYSKGDTEF
jgi:hypothetical protein